MSAAIERPASKWLRGYRLYLLTAAFTLADFMTAIDDSILAAAIPRITTEFKSTQHLGWYGAAYVLGQMSTQPLFGRIYLYFEAKSTYLASLCVFMVGSVLSAAAPTSQSLIIGRVVCGCGTAGMLTGSLTIFGQVVPLRIRPRGLAIVTAIESCGMMLGSTVGGAITDSSLTWRFCFWMNIPIGVLTGIVTFWILEKKEPDTDSSMKLVQKLSNLDPLNMIPLSASLVILFVGLEMGGISLSWSNPRVWGCLVVSALLGLAFGYFQYRKGDNASIPPRILGQRTVAVCCVFSFLYGAATYTHVYLLPIYFQGVRNASAAASSVFCLGFAVSTTLSSLVYGVFATRTGHFIPFIWVGSATYLVGSILLSWLSPRTSTAAFTGYQVICGIGVGLSAQVTYVAVQVVMPPRDMPTACSMEIFFRDLGGALGINAAQNILGSFLRAGLDGSAPALPGISSSSVANEGISDLVKLAHKLPAEGQALFATIMNGAITRAFILPIVATSLAAVVSLGIERKLLEDDTEMEGYKAVPEYELEDSSPR